MMQRSGIPTSPTSDSPTVLSHLLAYSNWLPTMNPVLPSTSSATRIGQQVSPDVNLFAMPSRYAENRSTAR